MLFRSVRTTRARTGAHLRRSPRPPSLRFVIYYWCGRLARRAPAEVQLVVGVLVSPGSRATRGAHLASSGRVWAEQRMHEGGGDRERRDWQAGARRTHARAICGPPVQVAIPTRRGAGMNGRGILVLDAAGGREMASGSMRRGGGTRELTARRIGVGCRSGADRKSVV